MTQTNTELVEAAKEVSRCMNCGSLTAIDALDAKPGVGWFMQDDLTFGADSGEDFERLECERCYGPNYTALQSNPDNIQEGGK